MNLEVYYLHSCARTSASWLKDSDVLTGVVSSLRLLCTAAMFQVAENDDLLVGPHDVAEPHVQWAMRSAYNYQWVFSYYETLCDIQTLQLGHNTINWRIRRRIQTYIELFPDIPFSPPPFLYDHSYLLPTTEESYRAYYKAEHARPGAYRRIQPPFWARGVRRGPVVMDVPTEFADLSDDPLADLR